MLEKRKLLAFSLLSSLCLASFASAQEESRRSRGGRDGESRGEFRGGSGGDFGGGPPPWMRGGEGGRPPMPGEGGPSFGGGGFGGGGFGGGEFGGRGGWGGRGGFGGGFGGRGGFDPSAMLSRLDTNGNKMIDPDEMQGPARFMIDRLARDNPKIDPTKPIPLSVITDSFGGGEDGEASDPASKEDEPLVPGFDDFEAPAPPPGFGKDGETQSVKIQETDLREAQERISRYDRNNDGSLDQDELNNGRWNDNPMQYDRNRDGKLQANELAVRYAKQRIDEKQNASSSNSNNNDDRRSRWGGWGGENSQEQQPQNGQQSDVEVKSPWSDRASYRIDAKANANSSASTVQGLPSWFTAADANSDGQVAMHEFTSDWDEKQVLEFEAFDANGDGVISSKECLAAVRKGLIRGSVNVGNSSTASPSSRPAAVEISTEGLPPDASERWVAFVRNRIIKMDANKNGVVTADEYGASENIAFNTVDTNGDGQITLAEFYIAKTKK